MENQNEKWPDWYYDFLAWVEREKPDIDLQDAQRVWEAAVNSDVEWCLNAMRVNQDSFNRAFIIDFMKDLMRQRIKSTDDDKIFDAVALKTFLAKYGLSDTQVKDVLGE